jgi:hypothetical protein
MATSRQSATSVTAAAVLAVGLVFAGWLIGTGLQVARKADRFVTVKGIAERTVAADLAIWPLRFVATGDELPTVQAELDRQQAAVLAFLQGLGFSDEEIELQDLQVTDLYAQAYRSGAVEDRFIVARTVTVRTAKVDAVRAASQRVGELVEARVVLSSEMGPAGNSPSYLFTGLVELKPAMIAEATANAREAAQQFATDSGSRLGGIRRANQGLFQILPRDDAPGSFEARQVDKTVRVVSTIDYLLVD